MWYVLLVVSVLLDGDSGDGVELSDTGASRGVDHLVSHFLVFRHGGDVRVAGDAGSHVAKCSW